MIIEFLSNILKNALKSIKKINANEMISNSNKRPHFVRSPLKNKLEITIDVY